MNLPELQGVQFLIQAIDPQGISPLNAKHDESLMISSSDICLTCKRDVVLCQLHLVILSYMLIVMMSVEIKVIEFFNTISSPLIILKSFFDSIEMSCKCGTIGMHAYACIHV